MLKRGNNSVIWAFASPVALILTYAALFYVLDRYDWDQAFVRFACLASLLAVCLACRGTQHPASGSRAEVLVALALAWVFLERGLEASFDDFTAPPVVDIGVSTQDAARMILVDGANPYQSRTIAVLGDDPMYWGYKYGPTMALGYALAAVSKTHGIKLTNALYLAISTILVYRLGRGNGTRAGARAAGWFCVALLLLPNRLWYELFHQGAIDIFPILLILGSLAAIGREAWFTAGVLAGLSFSAKFSPGVLFLILLFRKPWNARLFVGIGLGLVPFLPFLLWDAPALARNYLFFHLMKPGDSTSLHSITPKELHFLFPLFQAASAAVILVRNSRDEGAPLTRAFWLLVLILTTEVAYKEVHGNHLIWIIPFAALHLGTHRLGFLSGVVHALGLGRGTATRPTGSGAGPENSIAHPMQVGRAPLHASDGARPGAASGPT